MVSSESFSLSVEGSMPLQHGVGSFLGFLVLLFKMCVCVCVCVDGFVSVPVRMCAGVSASASR